LPPPTAAVFEAHVYARAVQLTVRVVGFACVIVGAVVIV